VLSNKVVGFLSRAARFVGLTCAINFGTGCSLSVLDGLSSGVAQVDAGAPVADDDAGPRVGEASVAPMDALPLQDATVFYDDGATIGSAMDAGSTDDAAEAGCGAGCPGKGYCLGSECVYASCKDRQAALPGSTGGVFKFDTDLGGSDAPFPAFCAMQLAGGGWTLLMKIDGNASTFHYDSPLWENDQTYQPDMANFDTNEAKLRSYVTLPFSTLLIGMHDNAGTRWTVLALGGSSLRDLMTTKYHPTALGRDVWEQIPGPGSLQLNCNLEGVNVITPHVSIRLGIVANEQNDCATCDSFIGFGAQHFADTMACGNLARSSPDHGDRVDPDFGYIFAR
jgi:hypothetical protein